MLIVGIILSLFGIGFFCWLLFTLAVYALPFFAGLTAGLAAYHNGSGLVGGVLAGLLASGVVLTLGQIAFASVRTPFARALIAFMYAAPAAVAGYQATLALARIGISSESFNEAVAIFGAITIGGTAWTRLARLTAHWPRATLHHPA